MKAIKITNERIEQILPVNIKESDVITKNAKKTLATIMNYFYTLDVVKENRCLMISTDMLREAVGIKKESMLAAMQELIEHDLIIREIGKKWERGMKPMASTYAVRWENLTKELKKKTPEDLFSAFLQVPDNQGGNYSISNSISNSVSSSNSNSVSISKSNSASYSNSISRSNSISGSNTYDVKVNKKESSYNKKAMQSMHSNTTIELKERNGTNTLKEECNGSSMIEVKENKGMQSKHARTFSIEELRKYCTVKVNELSRRYYEEVDVDTLEEELEAYLNRHSDVEGVDELMTDVFKETGELRGKLYFSGGMISENFEKAYNVERVF